MKQKIINTLNICFVLLRIFAIPILIMVLLFVFMSLRQAGEPKHVEKNEKYHKKMSVLLEVDDIEISDNKAVCYFSYKNNAFFTTEYIPKYLRAKKPEDVRFIVYCNSNLKKSDTHYGRKAIHVTEYYTISFKIVDRCNDEVIDHWSDEFISTIFDVDEIQSSIENSISKYLD